MRRHVILSIGFALGLHATGPVLAQDAAFYEAQLRTGREALSQGRAAQAVVHLRIAAFGLLGRAPLLHEALARLALAQQAAGHPEEAAAAIDRLVSIEQQLPGLSSAALEAETRAALRRLLEARVPRETLAAIPSFAAGVAASVPSPPRTGKTAAPAAAPAGAAPPGGSDPPEAAAVYASPRYRATIKPTYPASALRSRIGGIVLLRVLVSETGKAVKIDVVREVHPDLSAAAVGAVRRWDFEPARRNGVPVAAWTTVPIPFRP